MFNQSLKTDILPDVVKLKRYVVINAQVLQTSCINGKERTDKYYSGVSIDFYSNGF